MLRTVVGLVGVLTALFPDRMIDLFEAIAVENPGEVKRRPRATTGLRVEGVAIAVASLLGGSPYAWMMNVTGIFGAVVTLFPRLYRTIASNFLFVDPDDVEWKEQFATRVRIVGLIDVVLAMWTARKRRESMRRSVRETVADHDQTTADGTRRRRFLTVR